MQSPKTTPPEDDCFLAFITVLVDKVLTRNGVVLTDIPEKESGVRKAIKLHDLHNAA
jgi:hypothetical protein